MSTYAPVHVIGPWYNTFFPLSLPIRIDRSSLPEPTEWCRFTRGQRRILLLLADGVSREEMAARLGIRPRTIRGELWRVRSGLGLKGKYGNITLAVWVWSVVGDPRTAEEYPR